MASTLIPTPASVYVLQAYYCLTVTVVIISWSGQMQHVAVPAKDLVASQQVSRGSASMRLYYVIESQSFERTR